MVLYALRVALREHAKRWLLTAGGMMDSHLHAVFGVSSCSQRSKVESKHTEKPTGKHAFRTCGSQAKRVATTKEGEISG